MKIRGGYEISYDCSQPTPMILTLSVHPSRFPDLLTIDRLQLDPQIPANTYHDSFGNFCHVIRAPTGRVSMSTDFLLQDNGEPDATAPEGCTASTGGASGRRPDLSARQPLLRDRSPFGYGVVPFWADSQGVASGQGNLQLRP